MAQTNHAYSYIRFSRPEQLKGDSLRRQMELGDKWCQRNNYYLDTSLHLQDLGVSAFRGRNAADGKLAAFLQAVETGRVKKGSVLLIESLDRLSRQEVPDALELFLGILNRGITIVTLEPEQVFRRQGLSEIQLIIAIVIMSRAWEESHTKSRRLQEAWGKKRDRIEQKKLTSLCPAWLQLSEDGTKFEEIPDAVAIVRRIFTMAAEGIGSTQIGKTLHRENVEPIGLGRRRKKERAKYPKSWHRSYVQKILSNRATIGEYQPHAMKDGKRVPIGEPIANYFPAIIDESLFYRAQEGKSQRRGTTGRIGETLVNLFTGLLRDARDGSTMVLTQKGEGHQLVSSAAQRGENGSRYLAYPYASAEQGFLKFLCELKTSDVLPPQADTESVESRIAGKEAKIADIDRKIEKAKDALENKPADDFASGWDMLQRLEDRRKEELDALEHLKAELHCSAAATALRESQDLMDVLASAKTRNDRNLRLKLRSKIRQIVSEIWCLVYLVGNKRCLHFQVMMKNGDQRTAASVPPEILRVLLAASDIDDQARHFREYLCPSFDEYDLRDYRNWPDEVKADAERTEKLTEADKVLAVGCYRKGKNTKDRFRLWRKFSFRGRDSFQRLIQAAKKDGLL